jgi:hypothetical protein
MDDGRKYQTFPAEPGASLWRLAPRVRNVAEWIPRNAFCARVRTVLASFGTGCAGKWDHNRAGDIELVANKILPGPFYPFVMVSDFRLS